MKQDPAKFRNRYGYGEYSGFTPYRDSKNGVYVEGMDIVLEPFPWDVGSAIKFYIVEKVRPLDGGSIEERVLFDTVYYDTANPEHYSKMLALCSREVIGRSAEAMAHDLFFSLFSTSKFVKKYAPEIYKFYEDVKIKGGAKLSEGRLGSSSYREEKV